MLRLRDNEILLTLIVAAVMWVGVWKHDEVYRLARKTVAAIVQAVS